MERIDSDNTTLNNCDSGNGDSGERVGGSSAEAANFITIAIDEVLQRAVLSQSSGDLQAEAFRQALGNVDYNVHGPARNQAVEAAAAEAGLDAKALLPLACAVENLLVRGKSKLEKLDKLRRVKEEKELAKRKEKEEKELARQKEKEEKDLARQREREEKDLARQKEKKERALVAKHAEALALRRKLVCGFGLAFEKRIRSNLKEQQAAANQQPQESTAQRRGQLKARRSFSSQDQAVVVANAQAPTATKNSPTPRRRRCNSANESARPLAALENLVNLEELRGAERIEMKPISLNPATKKRCANGAAPTAAATATRKRKHSIEANSDSENQPLSAPEYFRRLCIRARKSGNAAVARAEHWTNYPIVIEGAVGYALSSWRDEMSLSKLRDNLIKVLSANMIMSHAVRESGISVSSFQVYYARARTILGDVLGAKEIDERLAPYAHKNVTIDELYERLAAFRRTLNSNTVSNNNNETDSDDMLRSGARRRAPPKAATAAKTATGIGSKSAASREPTTTTTSLTRTIAVAPSTSLSSYIAGPAAGVSTQSLAADPDDTMSPEKRRDVERWLRDSCPDFDILDKENEDLIALPEMGMEMPVKKRRKVAPTRFADEDFSLAQMTQQHQQQQHQRRSGLKTTLEKEVNLTGEKDRDKTKKTVKWAENIDDNSTIKRECMDEAGGDNDAMGEMMDGKENENNMHSRSFITNTTTTTPRPGLEDEEEDDDDDEHNDKSDEQYTTSAGDDDDEEEGGGGGEKVDSRVNKPTKPRTSRRRLGALAAANALQKPTTSSFADNTNASRSALTTSNSNGDVNARKPMITLLGATKKDENKPKRNELCKIGNLPGMEYRRFSGTSGQLFEEVKSIIKDRYPEDPDTMASLVTGAILKDVHMRSIMEESGITLDLMLTAYGVCGRQIAVDQLDITDLDLSMKFHAICRTDETKRNDNRVVDNAADDDGDDARMIEPFVTRAATSSEALLANSNVDLSIESVSERLVAALGASRPDLQLKAVIDYVVGVGYKRADEDRARLVACLEQILIDGLSVQVALNEFPTIRRVLAAEYSQRCERVHKLFTARFGELVTTIKNVKSKKLKASVNLAEVFNVEDAKFFRTLFVELQKLNCCVSPALVSRFVRRCAELKLAALSPKSALIWTNESGAEWLADNVVLDQDRSAPAPRRSVEKIKGKE